MNKKILYYFRLTIVMSLFFTQTSALGYDITDKFSIGGILAGAYHYQWVEGADDRGRGAVPFEPEISFTPEVSTSPANGTDEKTTTSVSDMPIGTVKMISTKRRSPRSTGVSSSIIMLPSQRMPSTCKTNTTPTTMIQMVLSSVFVGRLSSSC